MTLGANLDVSSEAPSGELSGELFPVSRSDSSPNVYARYVLD